MEKGKITISKLRLKRSIARESFEEFVRMFWHLVPGAEPVQWNWHMSFVCDELQKVAERVFRDEPKEHDVVVNIPPGTSKSTLCSILFPIWVWTRMPRARVLTASHTDQLALDLSTKSREVAKSELYHELFPEIEIVADQDTKSYWRNTMGGDRLTCTVGGKSPMGFHAHFLIVDDPIDPRKVLSELELNAAADFMTQTLSSRKVNKEVSVTFLIMQRLHSQDPTNVLLQNAKKEGGAVVRHIKLPAEVEDGPEPSELSRHYKEGLLDPIRLNKRMLKEAYANLGEYGYSGQYRQSPVRKGGGMFKVTYFNQRVKAAPYDSKRIRYYDRASTQDGGCFTAGVLMAKDADGNYYVEHVVKGQWEPDERNRIMRATALRDRTKYGPRHEPQIWVEAEGGSSGRDAWKMVARSLAGFNVREDKVTGDKDTRAEPFSCQCAANNVYIVEDGTWDVQAYIDELILFKPETGKRGKFKDQVDSSSGAYNLLAGARAMRAMRTYSFSIGKKKALRLVVARTDDLLAMTFDKHHKAMVVHLPDYGEDFIEPKVPFDVVDRIVLAFADLESKDYQDRWNEPIDLYNKLPEEVLMSQQQGKQLWSFLLKKRDPSPDVIVLHDDKGRRGQSIAEAIADCLSLPRKDTIFRPSADDNENEDEESNAYVYEMVRRTRNMVVG